MCCLNLKSLMIIAILSFSPISIYAQPDTSPGPDTSPDTSQGDKVFQEVCNKTWMERAGNVSDKLAFQNFGEKYCACAAGKPLNDDAALSKAAQTCMSQILLHDTMDTLQDEQGLENLTTDQIVAACQDKWALVYPDMNGNVKSHTTNYCQCAGPKLNELNANSANMTDKQWYDQIDAIANECAGNVEPDKATTSAKPTSG